MRVVPGSCLDTTVCLSVCLCPHLSAGVQVEGSRAGQNASGAGELQPGTGARSGQQQPAHPRPLHHEAGPQPAQHYRADSPQPR